MRPRTGIYEGVWAALLIKCFLSCSENSLRGRELVQLFFSAPLNGLLLSGTRSTSTCTRCWPRPTWISTTKTSKNFWELRTSGGTSRMAARTSSWRRWRSSASKPSSCTSTPCRSPRRWQKGHFRKTILVMDGATNKSLSDWCNSRNNAVCWLLTTDNVTSSEN